MKGNHSPKELCEIIGRESIETVDLRYLDYPGVWQSVSVPASGFTEAAFEEGVGFDGSCIRPWAEVNEGDMLLVPVPETAHLDPFTVRPTLGMICDIKDPVTKKRFSRDPRSVARKAEKYLAETGIADQAWFSPELEFFVFDRVRFGQTMAEAHVKIESTEGIWSRVNDDPMNHGYQIPAHTGQFPAPPMDGLHDLRAEIVAEAEQMGIEVAMHHHEVATGGQCEIDLRLQTLVRNADRLVLLKHLIRNVAVRHGRTATFMPKPLFGDNGSGMHLNFSLTLDGQNIFAGSRYAGMSSKGLHAIAGILKHGPALAALLAPTTNSYKRLVPGFEAPVHLIYASRNRAAAVRVPVYSGHPERKRIEIRIPDPACNPYLAYAAITMAALDGIQNELDPGEPFDRPLDLLEAEAYASIPRLPISLDRVLDALEEDHEFLTRGNVFPESLLRFWINYKRRDEIGSLRQRPHPHEFELYFNA